MSGAFTLGRDPATEAEVAAAMRDLGRALAARVPGSTVLLLGSLGAGEASVARARGGLRWLSDVEVALLRPAPPSRRTLAAARAAAAQAVSGAEVGVWWTPPLRVRVAGATGLTRNLWDLRHASRVLEGPDRLAALPRWSPSLLPPWEGWRLLFNRMAERLAAGDDGDPLRRASLRAKLLLGCVDAVLLADRGHRPGVEGRVAAFEDAGAAAALLPERPTLFREALAFRARPLLSEGDAFAQADLAAARTLGHLAKRPTAAEALAHLAHPAAWQGLGRPPWLGRAVDRLRHPHAHAARGLRRAPRGLPRDLAAYWLVAATFTGRVDPECAALLEAALGTADPAAAAQLSVEAWRRVCW